MFIILIIFLILIFVLLLITNYYVSLSKAQKYNRSDYDFLYKTVNGIKIAYIKRGNGFPLFLLHGFMSSSVCFQDILQHLALDNTVYAVDIIGFGFSDKNPKLSYTRCSMAEAIFNFIKSEGISKFNLLGHSMGGEVALNIAYNHQRHINKLILISSAGCQQIKVLPRCIVVNKKICNFIISKIFMTYYLQKMIFEASIINRNNYNKDIFNHIFSISKLNIPAETLRKLSNEADDCYILPKIRFIKRNTLIIWGEKDNVVPVRYAHKINRLIKNSKLVIMKDCKHNPYIEKPQEFLNILKGFLVSDSY